MENFKNSVIYITGGVGAIGSNLVRSLLKHSPKKIIIVDNLSSGDSKYLPKDKTIEFYNIDISNKEKLAPSIPTNTDYIFHLAAHFANQNSVDFPISDIKTNIIGTVNLLEVAKSLKIKKFINCSSSCLYGNKKSIMSVEDKIYPHETPYAINKLGAELYTSFYAEYHKVPTISIRIFNTYGPYELGGKYRNVVPNFIEKALKNKPLYITGDGLETRDFTYVDDTCDLLKLATVSNKSKGEIYNGGVGIPIKIIDLAKLVIKTCDSKSKIIFTSKRKWDNIPHRLSDIFLTKKHLKYSPHNLDLKKNLIKIVEWYKSQK